jgi:hypothetical protein
LSLPGKRQWPGWNYFLGRHGPFQAVSGQTAVWAPSQDVSCSNGFLPYLDEMAGNSWRYFLLSQPPAFSVLSKTDSTLE